MGGTRLTAVSRAEGRSSDNKGKVVTIDERSRIRPINNMDSRRHCMGIFFSASLEEEVLAFESAALRDEWVSKLTVRVCMLCARSSFHSIPLHNAQSLHVAFSYPRPSVGAGHSSCGGCSAHGAADSPGHVLLASHAAVADAILLQNFPMHPAVLQKKVRVVLPRVSVNCASLLPRPNFIRFARFRRRRSASKRLLKQSGSERFGRRRSARLHPRCCFPPLYSRAPISFVLQAAAASRIQGKPDILAAVKSGDLSLVRDHVTADPSCVGRRDGA